MVHMESVQRFIPCAQSRPAQGGKRQPIASREDKIDETVETIPEAVETVPETLSFRSFEQPG